MCAAGFLDQSTRGAGTDSAAESDVTPYEGPIDYGGYAPPDDDLDVH